jgi:glutamate--cysteine ligase catalytic subunit
MVESIPGTPYTGSISDLLSVESNMHFRSKFNLLKQCIFENVVERFSRRYLLQRHLKQDEIPVTLACFPRLGVEGIFTEPHFEPVNAVSSHSLFLPEEIHNHNSNPRYT